MASKRLHDMLDENYHSLTIKALDKLIERATQAKGHIEAGETSGMKYYTEDICKSAHDFTWAWHTLSGMRTGREEDREVEV